MSKLAMAAIVLLASAATLPACAATLQDMRWTKRVLVLFAASPDDAALGRQIAALRAEGPALLDRDLVVFAVAGERIVPVHGKPPTAETPASLAARLNTGPDAGAVLIGKDGGVKWRSGLPFPVRAVFDTIDAMPMRRGEMR